MENCATCHGPHGLGDGPMAEFMTLRVPDLTALSASSDGAFPMLRVIQAIDGRTGVRGHGTEMPIWGAEYKADAAATDYGAEIEARGRILSLAYYLQSLQK